MKFKEFLVKAIRYVPLHCYIFIQQKYYQKLLYDTLYHDKSVEKISQKRLIRILKYACKHTVYYKNVISKNVVSTKYLDQTEIEKIPVLTKEIIRVAGESLKSNMTEFIPHSTMKTSGTTGIPLEFLSSFSDEHSHQMFLYDFITEFKLKKVDKKKIVTFGGCYLPEDLPKHKIFWIPEKKGNLYGSMLFSSFYILRENISYINAELEQLQPDIIRSYPSCLLLYIDYCSELKVFPKISIKGIYVTSESVTEEQMIKISDFFNCGVYGQYGHSEAAIFAFTKRNQTKYYCSPIYGYTEVVNNKGKHVKKGELGEICVTSFSNYAMPFIRYKTGDLAVYGGTYNGFVVLDELIGRSQDYILNKDGEKLFIIVGQFSECFLPAMTRVYHWQAEQHEIGKMHLRIVKKDTFTHSDAEEIIAVMKRDKVETTLEFVDEIPLTQRGKYKYIINKLV